VIDNPIVQQASLRSQVWNARMPRVFSSGQQYYMSRLAWLGLGYAPLRHDATTVRRRTFNRVQRSIVLFTVVFRITSSTLDQNHCFLMGNTFFSPGINIVLMSMKVNLPLELTHFCSVGKSFKITTSSSASKLKIR
jgi:hypothetical protein